MKRRDGKPFGFSSKHSSGSPSVWNATGSLRPSAGFTIAECMAAVALISIGLTAFLGSINVLQDVQRRAADRQRAFHLIANAVSFAEGEAGRVEESVTVKGIDQVLALESGLHDGLFATVRVVGTQLVFRVDQTNEVPKRLVLKLNFPAPQ